MRAVLGLFVAMVLGWVLWRGWEIADKTGTLRKLTYETPPACRAVTGAVGGEDIQIDQQTGFAFVSAFDRRKAWAGDKSVRGMVGAFSIAEGDDHVTDLTNPTQSGAPQAFAPHGLSLYVAPDGKRTLAAVNHANGETVEIFDVIQEQGTDGPAVPRLKHRRTVGDPKFRNLNDVLLVGPEAFYATNDHHFPAGLMQTVENYLMLDEATVVYFDGSSARVAAKGLTYANGINVSPDGRRVYVAETTDNMLRTYDRNAATGDLAPIKEKWGKTDLGFGLDNIDVTADGSLVIGGHPKLFDFVAYAKDEKHPSPSEAVHLTLGKDGWKVKQVYLGDGRQISALSIAARLDAALVLGPIFGREILVCPFKE
ncbi:MAG: SMP-30/gluconolactonase/LRE family protein [Alphaproteobacteria bacterium]